MAQIVLTAGTSWPVPADWNNAANSIEVIGGGQNGGATAGGNGADYAKVSNVSLSGSIAYAIGQPGTTGGDTTFGSILLAKGGGSASTNIGSTTYAGGTGNAAGGGGGAAGPSGAGGNAPGTAGGTGNNGTVPADTSGTYWGTAGSGGGGSASSTKSVVQAVASTASTSTITLTFAAPPTAGNMLLIEIRQASTYMPSLPVTDQAGHVWTTVADTGTVSGATSTQRMLILSRMSDGSEQTIQITSGSSSYTSAALEIAGATAVNGVGMAIGAASKLNGTTYQLPTVTPTVPATLAVGFAGSTGTSIGISYTAASGWTLTPYGTSVASYTSAGTYQLQDASLSPVSTTLTASTTQSSTNVCAAMVLLQ